MPLPPHPCLRRDMAAADECPCCKQLFGSTPEMENHSLACGHVYHAECIDEYRLIKECDFDTLPCPICKLTAREVAGMEAHHLRGSQEGEDDGESHAPEAELVADDDTPDTPSAPGLALQGAPVPPPALVPVSWTAPGPRPAPPPPPAPVQGALPALPGVGAIAISSVPAWVMDDEPVVCQDCNEPSEMRRCRLMSKTLGTFRCNRCNSTCTTLHRTMGAGLGRMLKVIPFE